MVIKSHREMTREERDSRQRERSRLLKEYCPPLIVIDEETGEEKDYGHPCDQGCPCDRCIYDYELNLDYVKALISMGQPITAEEYNKYKEEIGENTVI